MRSTADVRRYVTAGAQVARTVVRSRVNGFEAASTARVAGSVRLSVDGRLRIGPRTLVDGRAGTVIITCEDGGEITIGEHCFFNYAVDLHCRSSITFGDRVLLGPYVAIADNQGHGVDPADDDAPRPVVIGDNVWIGRRAMVMPGVTIGSGTVVGAGAIVTHDLPPAVVAVGTPARVIHTLNLPAGWRR
jgi:acetyltransferase-like isoleucine patch superfamily enzyme